MKLKIFLVVLILTSVFCVSSMAYAQTLTNDQRLALINEIIQEIQQIQVQINQMLAQQQGTSSWCYNFYNDLGPANSGSSEVFNLHIALEKEGIPYVPDGANTYANGTYQAVSQFQAKYKITPQTGYAGPNTRAELNKLYGCTKVPSANCKPDWKCSNWGICYGGQQTKTCTDSNNCDLGTGEPALTQPCTEKPAVVLQANNSSGSVNIFLPLNNGASLNGSGFTLTRSINLQWTGADVASCYASDSLTPPIFSGYKSSSGSQMVNLSGNIQSASSGSVSGTFKINCVSILTGSTVSSSVTVNLFYTVSANCKPNWECGAWTTCKNNKQTRICTDFNGCGSTVGKPLLQESCVDLPTVNIKANSSDGPITVASGKTVSLSWTSSSAISCEASGDWSGTKPVSGSVKSSALNGTSIFILTCTNSAGSNIDSVKVDIPGS
jgi:hypothetical protein